MAASNTRVCTGWLLCQSAPTFDKFSIHLAAVVAGPVTSVWVVCSGTQQGLGVAVLYCARAVSSHLLPGAGMLCHAAVPKDADIVQANGAGEQGKSYEVVN